MYKKILGKVIHWKKLGRMIGFPTANIEVGKNKWLSSATYEVNGLIWWKVFRWVATYREEIELFEAHFFNFNNDIYWQEIEVQIYGKIRDNMKFESLEEIQQQIKKDVEYARSRSCTVLSFWTFDIFHPWHEHYLNTAKMYGNSLVCIVSTSQNRKKITWKIPLYSIDIRALWVEKSEIPDIVEYGSEDNPMKWVETYNPQVICLWYDQNSFSDELSQYLEKKSSHIDIIRIPSYKPEIYKSSKLKKTVKWIFKI